MKRPSWLPLFALCFAAAAAVTGLVVTRDQPAAADPKLPARHEWLVDEHPLQTARSLEALAATADEKTLVHRAQRLANHEMDLAFTDALRQAAENPPAPTPETRSRLEHKATEEAAVQADQLRIAELTRQVGAGAKGGLETQLDVAKAQLELDQDELDQATEDLERVGGDPQARIRRLQAAHAAMDTVVPPAALPDYAQGANLLDKIRAWSAARAKTRRLRQAGQEAQDKVRALAQRRATRAQRVEQERQERERTKQEAAGFVQSRTAGGDPSAEAAVGGTLNSLKHYMGDQRMLSDLGRRMEDGQDLAELYAGWAALAQGQQRSALHTLIKWLMAVLLVLALVYLADRLFEHLFRRLAKENKRVGRMLKVVKFTATAAGALAILFVLFGLPSQMTTLFGLAGAGLTVALKDFIVAFFGWFVLVGRNGIHVGDWVEINGVGGEVVEIGLLRTMLLETGSWSDCGHPTGRIASFVNSFAMEGHFFNFSTSGQWMWDELQVTVPPGRDPYPLLEAIQKRVEQETQANADLAEAEWRQSTKARRAESVSARPGINLVPSAAGLEIRIRYITRAYQRHETRAVLNQALVELLRSREPAAKD